MGLSWAILRLDPLARRYFKETLPFGEAIRSPTNKETFLLARLRDRPHEVVKQAMAVNAAAIILAHNRYLERKQLFLLC